MTNTIREQILDKLQRVYGEELAQQTFTQMDALLQPIQTDDPTQLAISEEDVILICYGDHIQDGQQPPLQVLHQFLKQHVHPTINSVHILPFFPWSSDDGFSVIDYYKIDSALGDWSHINAMNADFRLMFDAVFNHMSAESDWFQRYLAGEAPYDEYFIAVPPDTDLSQVMRPRALPLLTEFEAHDGTRHVWTTFSPDQIDLNAANPDVLLELLRILRFYVEQGADFIRLDAIAFLWKEIGTSSIHLEQTHLLIQLMRDVLDIIAPDVVLITETNVPHEENISYFGDGTNEAQMVYQFSLPPLVLHTLTAGDSTHLTQWAQSLDPIGERTTYFNFTASHDGIGMRPATGILNDEEISALVNLAQEHGGNVSYKTNSDGTQSPYELNITYFDAITQPDITAENPQLAVDRFMVSQAIQLAMAGIPGVYLHNLFGSRNWVEGVKQTRHYRTINREKLYVDELTHQLNDTKSIRHAVFTRYMQLLNIRREQAAMHPLAAQIIHDMGASVVAIERISRDEQQRLFALHNVTNESITLKLPAGRWLNLLNEGLVTDAITLQAYEVAWLVTA